ncbi:hypothetical protein ACP275_12G170400 [Erythranthe tilingii]
MNMLVEVHAQEVYICATKELIKEVQVAMDDAKRKLGKYFDVSAIVNRLPPPLPPRIPSPVDDDDDEVLDDDDEEMIEADFDDYFNKLRIIKKIDDKLEKLVKRHKQQEFDVKQMLNLTNYLMRATATTSYAAEVVSAIELYDSLLNKAVESYKKKLDLIPPPVRRNRTR